MSKYIYCISTGLVIKSYMMELSDIKLIRIGVISDEELLIKEYIKYYPDMEIVVMIDVRDYNGDMDELLSLFRYNLVCYKSDLYMYNYDDICRSISDINKKLNF